MGRPAKATAIELSAVAYGHRKRPLLFEDVSLAVAGGESVALMGPSGVGKSTLLSLALGILSPARGRVTVAGQDWSSLSKSVRARHRAAQIGMVFQFGELLDELSPVENVALPMMWSGKDGREAVERAEELLERLGVHTSASTTDVVSGGERQRIAVARALISDPQVVLADEPTGSLDSDNANALADVLFGLPREQGCALLVVTHSAEIAARADRVLRLSSAGTLAPDRAA